MKNYTDEDPVVTNLRRKFEKIKLMVTKEEMKDITDVLKEGSSWQVTI